MISLPLEQEWESYHLAPSQTTGICYSILVLFSPWEDELSRHLFRPTHSIVIGENVTSKPCACNELLTLTRKYLSRLTQNCPEPNGFCCSILDPIQHIPTMMTKHLILPYQILPHANDLPKPLNAEAGHYEEDDLPYIATISETIHPPPEEPLMTPNFFQTLLENDCLPSDQKCSDCLRNKKGSNCQKCASICPCYCKTLCHIPVEEKFIKKSLTVRPPLYARDPTRLVPKIVHQTWFEDVSQEKYPNMSRLIESFKQSGWDYKFYTDDEAANFLSTHFPPEVRQAYEALRPGAFKAGTL